MSTQRALIAITIALGTAACSGDAPPAAGASAAPAASAAPTAAAKPSAAESATPAAETGPETLGESPVVCTWTKGFIQHDEQDYPEFECKNTSSRDIDFVQFKVHYHDAEKTHRNDMPSAKSASPLLKAGEGKKLWLGYAKKHLKPEFAMMRAVATNGRYSGGQEWSVPALKKELQPSWVD
jgi:hypothetical protein